MLNLLSLGPLWNHPRKADSASCTQAPARGERRMLELSTSHSWGWERVGNAVLQQWHLSMWDFRTCLPWPSLQDNIRAGASLSHQPKMPKCICKAGGRIFMSIKEMKDFSESLSADHKLPVFGCNWQGTWRKCGASFSEDQRKICPFTLWCQKYVFRLFCYRNVLKSLLSISKTRSLLGIILVTLSGTKVCPKVAKWPLSFSNS